METKNCCDNCYEELGGGMTMLPLIRKCNNLDCQCHQEVKEKNKESWSDRFDRLTNPDNFEKGEYNKLLGEHLLSSEWYIESAYELNAEKLKHFITELLQEERAKWEKEYPVIHHGDGKNCWRCEKEEINVDVTNVIKEARNDLKQDLLSEIEKEYINPGELKVNIRELNQIQGINTGIQRAINIINKY